MIVRNNLTLSEIDSELYPGFDEKVRYHKKPIGIWGHCHSLYLREANKNKYDELMRNEQLLDYLELVDALAEEMYINNVKRLRKERHITPKLKKKSPAEWSVATTAIHRESKSLVYQQMAFVAEPVKKTELRRYIKYRSSLPLDEEPSLEGFRKFKRRKK